MEPLQKRKRKLLLFSAGIAGIGLLLFALALSCENALLTAVFALILIVHTAAVYKVGNNA